MTHSQEGWLIGLAPGARIGICGESAQNTVAAVRAWGSAIGRDFTFDTTCAGGATRYVSVYSATSEYARQRCAIDENGSGRGGADIATGTIFFCTQYDAQTLANAILHEVGHLWGMCDQYHADVGAADNCDPNHSGARVTASVMGSLAYATLQADDLAGIRALAERTDIPANALWRGQSGQTTSSTVGSPPQGTQGTGGPSSPPQGTQGTGGPSSPPQGTQGTGGQSSPPPGTQGTGVGSAGAPPSPQTPPGACACGWWSQGGSSYCGFRRGAAAVGSYFGPFAGAPVAGALDGWYCSLASGQFNDLCGRLGRPSGC